MKKSQFRASLLAASALSISIASQLHAAAYVSTLAGGVWEDSASWTAALGFPDTFGNDSAEITGGATIVYDDFNADGSGGVTTPATPFTIALAIVPGGLSVANGNSILINGASTFLQSGIQHEIRIGEGAGFQSAGAIQSGTGTLTIDDGTFLSGTAVGVAVGGDLDSNTANGTGSGTVNLKKGIFIMEVANFPAAGDPANLGVGIEGATGVFNVGDGVGAAGEAILDLRTNNNSMGVGVTNQITALAGNGAVIIKSDGLLTYGAGQIVVGDSATGAGLLQIDGGTLGEAIPGMGAVLIGSAGGSGTFNMNSGVVNSTGGFRVGTGTGATGVANFAGAGASTFNVGSLNVGLGGATGTMTIADANAAVTVNGNTVIGEGVGSIGAVGLTAGSFSTRLLGVGASGGTGTLNISGATTTSIIGGGQSFIGRDAGSVGTVNIAGSLVNNNSGQDWQIGFNGGTGNLNVTGGGVINHNWWLNVARGGGSVGNVLIDGVGSKYTTVLSDSRTNIGEDGTGKLSVRNGGLFESRELIVGRNGGSNGEVNINTGGVVTADQWLAVGNSGGATGVVNVDGVGSKLKMLGVVSGRNNGAGGDTQVGLNGGTGTVNVTNGGTFETGWWLNIARGGGSTGTVNVDGAGSKVVVGIPTVTGGHIGQGGDGKTNIGENGTGTVNVSNGAEFTAGALGGQGGRELYVGRNGGSQGFLNVSSGAVVHANGGWSMLVADGGGSTGTVDIKTGGQVLANNWIVMGNGGGSNGTINIDGAGSVLESGTPSGGSHEGRLIVGRQGTATLNQTGGTVRADNWLAIGIDGGGNGTYNFGGGKIELAMPGYGGRNIIVGNNGTGTMNITHGTPAGDTIVSSIVDPNHGTRINQFNVGGDSFGNGTLNISLTDPAGVIVHRELYVGWSSNGTASQGTVNITQGTLRTDGWAEIGRGNAGNGGTGTVNVLGPTARWERGTLAPGTADGEGTRDMNIGQGQNNNRAKGYLNVSAGGTVNQNWWINLGRQTGSEGHITVDGAGSSVNMVDAHTHGLGGDGNSQLNVGEGGTGTLDITNGGLFTHNRDHGGGEVHIARNDGAVGTVTVTGAGSALLSFGREFRVASNSGTGTLNITNGGVVDFSSHRENGVKADGNFGVAENGTGNGTINMNNGTLNVSAWSLFSAWNGAGTNATINMTNSIINISDEGYIDGGGNPGNGGHLFWGDAGTATINQKGGQINAHGWSAIGRERGGNATYNLGVAGGGGSMTVGGLGGNELYVGRQSHGTINMGLGTSLTVTNALNLGQETSPTTPSSGTITNNGGTITVGGEFNVGRNGGVGVLGTFTQNSGTTTADVTIIGRDTTTGVFNMNGGTLTSNNHFNVGDNGVGTVNQTAGTVNVSNQWFALAPGGGSTGTYNISAGLLNTSTIGLEVGADGNGFLNITGTGTVTANNVAVGVRSTGVGTINITGGLLHANDHITLGGDQSGGTGTLNLLGGVVETTYIAAQNIATLNLGPGTLRATATQADFLRGFTNSGSHSAVNLIGTGPTIDTGAFNVRITQTNVFADTDGLIDGLAGTVVSKTGAGTLTVESPIDTDGTVSAHVIAGTLDFEASQTLDGLFIDGGATVTLSALSTPPAPLEAPAPPAAMFDGAFDAALAPESNLSAAAVQGVPEPGTLGMLLVTALGMLGRRNRRKDS